MAAVAVEVFLLVAVAVVLVAMVVGSRRETKTCCLMAEVPGRGPVDVVLAVPWSK